MTNIEECKIDVTVGNDQKMKCELKVTANIKLQVGETFKFTEVLYVPQAVKNILSILRFVSNVSTTGDTKDKMTTKKNGVNMIDARKRKSDSTMFYLK